MFRSKFIKPKKNESNTPDNNNNNPVNTINNLAKSELPSNIEVDSRGFPKPIKDNLSNLTSGLNNIVNTVGNNSNTLNTPFKTDKMGFPKPKKCDGPSSAMDPDCININDLNPAALSGTNIGSSLLQDTLNKKPRPKLKIQQATQEAIEDITNAGIHFAVQTGAIGLNKVLDMISFTLLGINGNLLNISNKEEILKKLEEKIVLFQYLAHDEKSKQVVRKLFGALGLIIMEGSEVAKEPLLRAFINLSNSTTSGVNNMVLNAGKFIKNAIKIIPVIGDAYIILDNALAIVIAGSRAGRMQAKNNEELAKTSKEVLKRLKIDFEPPLKEYESSMDEIENIKSNLDNVDIDTMLKQTEQNLGNIIQSTENNIAQGIKKSGDATTNAIISATPKPKKKGYFFGGNKLKSSLKQKGKGNGTKKKGGKRVRFQL